jgi:hypothetical protein
MLAMSVESVLVVAMEMVMNFLLRMARLMYDGERQSSENGLCVIGRRSRRAQTEDSALCRADGVGLSADLSISLAMLATLVALVVLAVLVVLVELSSNNSNKIKTRCRCRCCCCAD